MDNLMTWFTMGGYGAYVWSTYGLVFLGLGLGLLRARGLRLQTRRSLHRWLSRDR